ncbi:MAG: hypothetical protein V1782_00255 [Pseudomonadota bacterium]
MKNSKDVQMPKVIIHVEGGLVQAVYSAEELDIQVYDLDMPDFATYTEIEAIKAIAAEFETEIKELQQIY